MSVSYDPDTGYLIEDDVDPWFEISSFEAADQPEVADQPEAADQSEAADQPEALDQVDDDIFSDWQSYVQSSEYQEFLAGLSDPVAVSSQDPIRVILSSDDQAVLSDFDVVPFADVDPITPSDANGLKAILLSVIGDYESIIVEYRYQNSGSSTYQYLRQVVPDYPWLLSATLFIVLIISVFRIAGGFLWKR